jgi:lactoylglutathione lyase
LRYTTKGYRRPLHWVYKIGDLNQTLSFYSKSFGLKLFRHEEFATGCEATCNGPYGGAWSKTMVGAADSPGEHDTFALELTCNYGIGGYERGNDLRYIAVRKSAFRGDPSIVLTDAKGKKFVESPDGNFFMLVEDGGGAVGSSQTSPSPFLFVSLHTSDLAAARAFYVEGLGGKVLTDDDRRRIPGALVTDDSIFVQWPNPLRTDGSSDVGIELVQLPPDEKHVYRGTAHGRLAIETEDSMPAAMGATVQKLASSSKQAGVTGGSVLHGPIKLQPHGEEVVIIQDFDGHEYCFVDARGFKVCTDVAYSQVSPTQRAHYYYPLIRLFLTR